MTPDESKGEFLWFDSSFRAGVTEADGGHSMFLQVMVRSMQRKMDQDSVTPVDIWIGPMQPHSFMSQGEQIQGMCRVTKVLFKPGKSEKSFKDWLIPDHPEVK